MPQESLKTGLKGLAQLAFDILKNTVFAPVGALNKALHDSESSHSESSRSGSQDLSVAGDEPEGLLQ
jgi:hypothetical protein